MSTRDPSLAAGSAYPQARSTLVSPSFETDAAKERNSLLLPLGNAEIIDRQLLEKLSAMGFEPKAEFHVTALDDKPGSEVAQLIHGLDETHQTGLFDFIRKTAKNDPWEVSPRDEFYLIEKQYEGEEVPRRSVIQIVDCPALDAFYTTLRELLPDGSEIEAPPAHITIATQGSPRGIGISKAADIQSHGRRIHIV